jgi:thioredoxin 1
LDIPRVLNQEKLITLAAAIAVKLKFIHTNFNILSNFIIMENIYEFKSGEDNIEKLVKEADVPLLLDFYADWCGPCKELYPKLVELVTKASKKFRIVKINIDDNPDMEELFEVPGLPYIVGFRDGKKVGAVMGLNMDEINKIIEKF